MALYLIILLLPFFICCFLILVDLIQIDIERSRAVKLNNKIKAFITKEQFVVYADLCFEASKTAIQHLLVDLDTRQICLCDYKNQYMSIVDFSDILGFYVIKNDVIIINSKENYDESILYSEKDSGICKNLKLVIQTNCSKWNEVEYTLIPKRAFSGYNESAPRYIESVKFIQRFLSLNSKIREFQDYEHDLLL